MGIRARGTWKNKVLFKEFKISFVVQFRIMTGVQAVTFEMCGLSTVGEILTGVKEFRTQPRRWKIRWLSMCVLCSLDTLAGTGAEKDSGAKVLE